MKDKHTATCGVKVLTMAALMTGMMGLGAHAADITWTNTAGGSFGTDINWQPNDVPGATDDEGIFDLEADPAYTITIDQARTVGALRVRNDTVILDLNGYNLNLDRPMSGAWGGADAFTGMTALMVARDGGETGVLIVTNSSPTTATLTASSFLVGGLLYPKSNGTLIFTGPNVVFTTDASFWDGVSVAIRGDGTLIARDGARINHDRLALGRQGSAWGEVIIEGEGSLLSGEALNDNRGGGHVIIRDQGTMELSSLTLAERSADTWITVTNATASAAIIQTGRFQAVGHIRVYRDGLLSGSTVYLGRATVNNWSTAAGGTVIVRGENARLEMQFSLFAGGNGSVEDKETQADVTVDQGGAIVLGTQLRLHSKATLTIDDGTVTVGTNFDVTDSASSEQEYNLTLHSPAAIPLHVSNNATLGDGVLTFTPTLGPAFSPARGDSFTVLRYEGELTGTFKDLDEEHLFELGDYQFILSYGSGTDDAITLRQPPGGTLFMVR